MASTSLLLLALQAAASPSAHHLEAVTGTSLLLSVSPYAGATSLAWEAALQGPVLRTWSWGAGARLALESLRPEGFLRWMATPTFDAWEPAAGVELGLSGRNEFTNDEKLLRETREHSLEGTSSAYVALAGRPLRFRFWDHWHVSALELRIGTYLAPLGRVVRLDVGIVYLGADL